MAQPTRHPIPQAETSLGSVTDRDPYGFLNDARSAGEILWDAGLNAWLVLGYEACRYVTRHDATFRHPVRGRIVGEEISNIINGGPRSLTQLQGEEHHRLHRFMISMLSPTAVEDFRSRFAVPLVNRCIDAFAGAGRVELTSAFSDELPSRFIATVLGLPVDDEELLAGCAHNHHDIMRFLTYTGTVSEPLSDADPMVRDAVAASLRMDELLLPVIRARRAAPREDLISRMWSEGPSVLDGWTEQDVLTTCRLMFLAGSDTTASGISNTVHLLLSRPELLGKVLADRALLSGFVEESLRLYGPTLGRPRFADQDAEVAGAAVKKGQMLFCLTAAANRDPAKFDAPDVVDPERDNVRQHMTFLVGPRTCVGASFARAAIEESVGGLLDRLPNLRFDPDAEPARISGFLMRAFGPLHLRFDA